MDVFEEPDLVVGADATVNGHLECGPLTRDGTGRKLQSDNDKVFYSVT